MRLCSSVSRFRSHS